MSKAGLTAGVGSCAHGGAHCVCTCVRRGEFSADNVCACAYVCVCVCVHCVCARARVCVQIKQGRKDLRDYARAQGLLGVSVYACVV